jgi:purine nucleosidase
MTRLVIDTDPGVDDAHAIMMALAHPQAQVEAITTVAGNVSLNRTTANACTILDICDRDVPVYAGCNKPIMGYFGDASYIHGKDGLGDSNFPPSKREVASEHAVNVLMRLADESSGDLTLVTIGPLTNVAIATRLDPVLPEKYKRLVMMGGAIRSMGNTQNTSAEFNIYTDPEAAAIVFDTWKEVTLISWETTLAHCLTAEQIEALGAFDTPRSEFFKRITENTVEFIQQVLGRKVLFAPDSLAMAVALEPDVVQKAESHFVQVEVAGNHTRGQTTVDWYDRTGVDSNANIILNVDMVRFWELMEAAVK